MYSEEFLSVSDVTSMLKRAIDERPELHSLRIRAEISNFKNHGSGHLYLTLKDEFSSISAVMFSQNAQRLNFIPQSGMKVLVGGYLSLYQKTGSCQIYITTMLRDGEGELYLAYERLKAKLREEGIFDEANKKPLPAYPKTVGVITSPTGAAVRDIINISQRRFPLAKIFIYPSLVQGDGAEENLIRGIRSFNINKNADVIIIGRGGGSIEDLWAFNGEALAREIYASEIPIISAVGHETDVTIADYAADKRAPTPSAAAELALPDSLNVSKGLQMQLSKMYSNLCRALDNAKQRLNYSAGHSALAHPERYFSERKSELIMLEEKLFSEIENSMEKRSLRFSVLSQRLDALSPLKTLSRGYTALSDNDGFPVVSAEQLDVGDAVTLTLSDGTANAEITKINRSIK